MIQITADTRRAVVTNKELLTVGSAGIQVEFTLSEDWNALSKLAVFRVGDDGTKVDVVLGESLTCVVPPEVLKDEDEVLFIGVYGANGQGTVIIPTIWASAGVVKPGTEPETPASAEPTPEIWAQILSVANDAEQTATEAMSAVEAGLQDLSALEGNVETAEAQRVANEQGRVFNEQQRVNAEIARASAEAGRASAESARADAEQARTTAEAGRVTAENARVTAEASRVTAEEGRVAAEENREAHYAEYVTTVQGYANAASASATSAAGSATDAASSASSASTSAGQAASSASSASTSASQASSSASSASTSATTASNAATTATTKAGEAASSATSASGSATSAVSAKTAAEAAQQAAEEAAESIEESAAQIAQNTQDISDVKNAISEIAPRLDDYPKYAGYIESNLWKSIGSGSNQYTIIPVNSGDKINIHAPSTGDTVIAALKTYSSPTTGTSPDFSEATGWTGIVRTYANQTNGFEMPSDANYLYVFLGAKPTYPRKPTSFIVNGYDIAGTMFDQFGELLLRVDSIEDIAVVSDGIKDLSKYPVLTGWIDNSANPQVWKIANFSSIIPVNGGEKIEIIAPTTSNNRVAYAALKTFTGVVKNSTPDFSSAEGWNAVRYVEVTNGFIGQLPDDARYLYLYRGNSTTYNRTPISLVIGGYDIIKSFGNNIGNKVSKNGAVPTIRFMQWNIGAFDYGRKPSTGNPAGMSDEQYAEKLPKYREFFCKYRPEILCMQECLQYVDKNHNHESDDVLFNDILPYSAKSGELRIKSVFPIVEYGTGSVAGVSVSVPYLMAILNVYGKHVAVFTTALDYVASANGYANRAQQFANLLNIASQYEYAVVCGDINCSGNGSDITSRDEAIELVSYAETVGWEGCNGGYLGWYVTHHDTQNTLDNILYKDNGTEIFRNFKVLSDEYENVSSDHYALIADIAIN